MPSLLDTLAREGLLKHASEHDSAAGSAAASRVVPGEPPHVSLLRLCDAGLLTHGLAVAHGVRPDELVGPLTAAMGGAARRFKVLDVRERPALQLHVLAGDVTERWEVEDLAALVHHLNDVYRQAPDVRPVALLGEWNDALQLLCVERRALPRLLRQPFFAPLNQRQLAGLLEPG